MRGRRKISHATKNQDKRKRTHDAVARTTGVRAKPVVPVADPLDSILVTVLTEIRPHH